MPCGRDCSHWHRTGPPDARQPRSGELCRLLVVTGIIEFSQHGVIERSNVAEGLLQLAEDLLDAVEFWQRVMPIERQ
jgi:hypothetical protein